MPSKNEKMLNKILAVVYNFQDNVQNGFFYKTLDKNN
jgi:hypothetical protein